MRSLQSIADGLVSRYTNRRLHRASSTDASARFLSTAVIHNNGRPSAIRVGRESVIGGELLVYPDGGDVQIGAHCFVGAGTRIWSAVGIRVGDRVLISHDVNIHDNNSHSVSARERHQHFVEILLKHNASLGNVPKAAIVIEDDAWIGFNASVMKGVRIGRGAIVAAGAVVTRDVAPFTIVAGIPATVIGSSQE